MLQGILLCMWPHVHTCVLIRRGGSNVFLSHVPANATVFSAPGRMPCSCLPLERVNKFSVHSSVQCQRFPGVCTGLPHGYAGGSSPVNSGRQNIRNERTRLGKVGQEGMQVCGGGGECGEHLRPLGGDRRHLSSCRGAAKTTHGSTLSY